MTLGLTHPYREESQKFVFLNVMCFLSWFSQDAIRMMITQANNHLEELKKSLALAGSWTLQAAVDFGLTIALSLLLLLIVRRRKSAWDHRNSPTCKLNRSLYIVCNVNIKYKFIKYIKSLIHFLKKPKTCFLALSYRVHYPYSTTYKHESLHPTYSRH